MGNSFGSGIIVFQVSASPRAPSRAERIEIDRIRFRVDRPSIVTLVASSLRHIILPELPLYIVIPPKFFDSDDDDESGGDIHGIIWRPQVGWLVNIGL